jgi:seryl-tRNA synthetase
MLLLQTLRNEKDRVLAGLAKRQVADAAQLVDQAIALDDQRKALQTANEQLLSERNKLSKEIGGLMKSGRHEEGKALRDKVNAMKEELAVGEEKLKTVKNELESILLQLPNVPHELVPAGVTEEDNEVFQAYPGELPKLPGDAKPHWELAEEYGIFDLELGVRTTGSGFQCLPARVPAWRAGWSTSSWIVILPRGIPNINHPCWSTKIPLGPPDSCPIRKGRCTTLRVMTCT